MSEIVSFKVKEGADLSVWRMLTNNLLDEFVFKKSVQSEDGSNKKYRVAKLSHYWLGFESEKETSFSIYFCGARIMKNNGKVFKVEIPIVLLFCNLVLEFDEDPGEVKFLYKDVTSQKRDELFEKERIYLEEYNLWVSKGHISNIYC